MIKQALMQMIKQAIKEDITPFMYDKDFTPSNIPKVLGGIAGVLGGGLLGATAGGLIGRQTSSMFDDNTNTGGLIGALLGAGLGGYAGYSLPNQSVPTVEDKIRDKFLWAHIKSPKDEDLLLLQALKHINKYPKGQLQTVLSDVGGYEWLNNKNKINAVKNLMMANWVNKINPNTPQYKNIVEEYNKSFGH